MSALKNRFWPNVAASSLLLGATFACTGSSVEGGEIANTSFSPRSAIHVETDNNRIRIIMSERADLCARLQEDDSRIEDEKSLSIDISDVEISGFDVDYNVLEPGDYDIREGFGDFEGRGSNATFIELDDDCDVDEVEVASEGEVLIDALDEKGIISGTFELEFDGDNAEGSFRAGYCDIDERDIERDSDECDP